MSRLTVSKVFDLTRTLQEKAGKELQFAWEYVAEFAEQTVRTLKKGITFADNCDMQFTTVTLTHNVVSAINTSDRSPVWVHPVRVVSTTVGIDSWRWYQAADGSYEVVAHFTGAPAAAQTVVLAIFFG